ncbi:ROK family protein [Nocardia bovistercoris]|uniref:ROK family protein n=1 Tax=Nocardia bovistercoris TaxID=2785916 RepID=A0A931IF80_9NOCA|nr:ROK family protein [Nocardia bovistercoris]MBH0780612.1 ROK family protein [Nocardia bovistercoris]
MVDSGAGGAILRTILASGPVPRSVVAKHAGLSPATVTWQTRALLEAGLLLELPETASGSGIGRPYSPLTLDTSGNVVIAVHIAAAQTTVAVVDIGGALRSSTRVPHRDTAPSHILDDAAAEIARVRATRSERVLGVGVAIGGRVDRDAGTVVEHSSLRWRDVPVRRRLEAVTGLPTELDSHTRALMHAEHLYGRLRGTASSMVVFVGNVVDMAFAVGDRVHYGPNSAAGSIDRMLGLAESRDGSARATVEQFSDHGLLRRARTRAPAAHTIPELIEAARNPGPAHDLFVERGVEMGRVTAALIDLLDPEAVVIVDRGFTGLAEVEATYLRTIGEYSALCARPAEVVSRSTFAGRVLETAGAAVALHGIFHTPLNALERKAV